MLCERNHSELMRQLLAVAIFAIARRPRIVRSNVRPAEKYAHEVQASSPAGSVP
jgi:hypothetical protein